MKVLDSSAFTVKKTIWSSFDGLAFDLNWFAFKWLQLADYSPRRAVKSVRLSLKRDITNHVV